jgi:hypothetical protein
MENIVQSVKCGTEIQSKIIKKNIMFSKYDKLNYQAWKDNADHRRKQGTIKQVHKKRVKQAKKSTWTDNCIIKLSTGLSTEKFDSVCYNRRAKLSGTQAKRSERAD